MKRKVIFLGYNKCGTCKKAEGWLKKHDMSYEYRSIVENPPTKIELETWVKASGVSVRKWLNTSGQSYRAIGKEKIDAASDETLMKWLAADGKLVRRPVVVAGAQVLVGFRDDAFAAVFSP